MSLEDKRLNKKDIWSISGNLAEILNVSRQEITKREADNDFAGVRNLRKIQKSFWYNSSNGVHRLPFRQFGV